MQEVSFLKKSIRMLTIVVSVAIMISTLFSLSVEATDNDIVNITINGSYNYDYAFEALDILNNYRVDAGLSKYVMEKSLLEQSMERAAEISVYFSHDRPNGKQGLGGETCAQYSRTPKEVIDDFMNSPRHKAILMRGDYDLGTFEESHDNYNVGVGCFRDAAGRYRWIFGFGKDEDIPATHEQFSGIKSVKLNIEILKSYITDEYWTLFVDERDTDIECTYGSVSDVPYGVCTTHLYNSTRVDSADFIISSSNPEVAKVDESKETVIIGNVGTATIKATLKEDPSIYFERKITVKPKELWSEYFSLEKNTYYYDGTEQKAKVLNNNSFVEGKDYVVNYENNIGDPNEYEITAKAIITGINNYTGTVEKNFWIANSPCVEYNYRKGYYYNHNYSTEWTIDKNATCTSEGSKSHHCTVCGDKTDVTVIPKVAHTYETYTVDKEPTCAETGIRSYKCTVCGQSITEEIPKLDHNYSCEEILSPTCIDMGSVLVTCSECGESHVEAVPTKGHNYTVKVVKSSYTVQGYTIYTCIDCGYSYKDNYTPKLVLDNVSGFKAPVTTANAVKLTWNKTKNATGYIVYRYNATAKKWSRITKVKNNVFTDKKLASGTTYKYAVKAYRTENGKEVLSPKYPNVITSTLPATVNFKLASARGKTVVMWSKTRGATGYVVYYKTSAKGKWYRVKVTKGTSYTNTKLRRGRSYYFTVRAYKNLNGKNYYGSFKTKSIKAK